VPLSRTPCHGLLVPLDTAAAAAAAILREARLPLFAGLATDVNGTRAVLDLAERCGAVVDHMNSSAKLRNLLTMQSAGWITTTLTEVRNRADFLLIVGSEVSVRFPRLYERILPRETLFGEQLQREIVYLGQIERAEQALGHAVSILNCDNRALPDILAALRALINERRLDCARIAAADQKYLADLADRMRRAKYGVVLWAAPDLDFAHAELAVQTLTELVRDLNRTTRFAALPLGGSEGDFTMNAVHLWQTGFPFRTSFAAASPDYDPHLHSTARLLDSGEADALLWISAFNDTRVPPRTDAPSIVLGPSSMRLENEPRVFIPVGTPGIHHTGHFFRTDKVVALPLRKLREAGLPSVADAIHAIQSSL
jgi:formylmethanofuran dehydrogenase subunit B